MKSFSKFKKDLSEMDRSIAGPSFVGGGLRAMLNVAKQPIEKVSRVTNVLRSDKGKKILTDLLGTPDKPKESNWEKNPKDIIDAQLNADQRRVKQRAKYKDYDAAMKAAKKAKDAGNITDSDYIGKVKEAGKLRGGQGNKGRTTKK